jgi:regulator of protease activity HflC (stomatin/prohibitin superfamily)
MSGKKITALILGLALAALVLLFAVSGVKTIQTGEIGVVKTFGVSRTTLEPGLHFLNPITQSLVKYDTKTREISFEFQAYSKDAQTVTGQLSVQYHIQPEKALDISREYGSLAGLEEKLRSAIPERAKSVFSDRGAMALVESRSSLSGEIEQRILPEVAKYYVSVTMVALSDIAFNDAFESAVEQKMVSEQEKLRADYEKEKAIIKAEEQVEVAKREIEATIARAGGDAEANISRANGDAKALRIMQEAWSALSAEVKDAMLRQTFYEKWDGVLPGVMSGDNMEIIIGEGITRQ